MLATEHTHPLPIDTSFDEPFVDTLAKQALLHAVVFVLGSAETTPAKLWHLPTQVDKNNRYTFWQ